MTKLLNCDLKSKNVQVRGLRNCSMTEEVRDFINNYKQYIAEIFNKKEKKTA